jgi:CheY-like chemotaxis protein
MTANAQKSEKELFMASGMDDYLSKPFNTRDLLWVMDRIYKQLDRKTI